jgi:hypothetical protein
VAKSSRKYEACTTIHVRALLLWVGHCFLLHVDSSKPHLPFHRRPVRSHLYLHSSFPSQQNQENLHSLMALLKTTLREFSPFKDRPSNYESLQHRDSDDSSTPRPITFTSDARNRACCFTAGLLAAVLVFILSLSAIHVLTPSPRTAAEREAEDWNYCGRSSTIAMERGCVMEPLFYGWMPPQCSWKEFSDKWPVFEDRKWYSDMNMTIPIPPEDLWAGRHVHIYTSRLATYVLYQISRSCTNGS